MTKEELITEIVSKGAQCYSGVKNGQSAQEQIAALVAFYVNVRASLINGGATEVEVAPMEALPEVELNEAE